MTRLDWEKRARIERERLTRPEKHPQTARYWWITSKFDSRCSLCRERIGQGDKAIFDMVEKLAICEICADASGVTAEAKQSKSARWGKRKK